MQTLRIHILSTPKALAVLRRDQVPVALAGQETDATFDGFNYFVKWPIQGKGNPPRLGNWNIAPECFVVLQPVNL
jgi:hypothetical protein